MSCYQWRDVRHFAMVCVGIAIVILTIFIMGICALSTSTGIPLEPSDELILGQAAIFGIGLLAVFVVLVWFELRFIELQRRIRTRRWAQPVNWH